MDFYFGIDLLQQLRQYYEGRLSLALAKGFDQQDAKYHWLFKELECRVSTLRKLMSMISVLPEFMCRQTEEQIFAMVIGHTTTWFSNENLGGEQPRDAKGNCLYYQDTVALSLGIYYAELNTGAFQNHFITFSENPKLVEIKGKDIYEKVRYCHQFNEVANTNIQRVFELILKTAVKNRVPQKDMPAKIFIISDMEFDYCTEDCSLTNFEYAQRLFEEHGYQLPEVMFWNVASRNQQQPVKINDQGVALVSGCNPRIFSMLKAGILSPYAFMMDVLGSERYAAIVA